MFALARSCVLNKNTCENLSLALHVKQLSALNTVRRPEQPASRTIYPKQTKKQNTAMTKQLHFYLQYRLIADLKDI